MGRGKGGVISHFTDKTKLNVMFTRYKKENVAYPNP